MTEEECKDQDWAWIHQQNNNNKRAAIIYSVPCLPRLPHSVVSALVSLPTPLGRTRQGLV